MKVLHIFDRYLNTTMNWAHNFIVQLEEVESYVTAPLQFKSRYTEGVIVLDSPVQKILPTPKDEWSIPIFYRAVDKIFPFLYNHWLSRLVNELKPDVIHAHFGAIGVRHMKWVAKTGIPYVTSFYGFDMEKLPFVKPEYGHYYRELSKIAHGFIVLGHSSKRTLVEKFGFNPERIFVHPLGVSTSNIPFHIRTKRRNELRLLQIATITPKKGQLDVIKALHRVLPSCPNVHYTLTGEPWDKVYFNKIKAYINANNLHEVVTILPFTPHQKIFNLMSAHDVFIHPSQYTDKLDSEGGATFAILEAMAAGMPVISTDHRSIPERVIHNEMGIIVPEKDILKLSEAIERIYTIRPEFFQQMSQACRNQVEKNYDTQLLSKSLTSYYSSLIK